MTSAAPGPVLLCIDLQPVFLNIMPRREALLRRCALAIEAARGLGLPVVFTEQAPGKLGPTAPELLALAPGAPQLAKSSFSALGEDSIQAALSALGAEHLLICGLETPVCVYQTAIDAIGAGTPVTLLSDCLAARRDDDARDALAALRHAGANILPSETIFYSLLRDIHHPFFKGYTQLVKKYG